MINRDSRTALTLYALSSITVLAGAAVAPGLALIGQHFSGTDPFFINMILTLPSLMVLPGASLSARLSAKRGKKQALCLGLLLYFTGGCAAGAATSIGFLLGCRAVLGLGMGIITPLGHSLPGDFYTGSDRLTVVSRMSAFSTFGACVCSVIVGWLVLLSWRAGFIVYAMSLPVLLLVMFALPPAPHAPSGNDRGKPSPLVYLTALSMMAYMAVFYITPLNTASLLLEKNLGDTRMAGYMLALISLVAFGLGFVFSKIHFRLGSLSYPVLCFTLGAGYITAGLAGNMAALLLACLLIGLAVGGFSAFHFITVNRLSDKAGLIKSLAVLTTGLFLGQFFSPFLIKGLQCLPLIQSSADIFFWCGLGVVLAGLPVTVLFIKHR